MPRERSPDPSKLRVENLLFLAQAFGLLFQRWESAFCISGNDEPIACGASVGAVGSRMTHVLRWDNRVAPKGVASLSRRASLHLLMGLDQFSARKDDGKPPRGAKSFGI
jgi:hypothetical protein